MGQLRPDRRPSHRHNAHGSTAREGVVDSNCALFEPPNLFIAGSAVFCTSSHANTTLTIVAFAVRLAAHLKKLAI